MNKEDTTNMANDQKAFMLTGDQSVDENCTPQKTMYLNLVREEFIELGFPHLTKQQQEDLGNSLAVDFDSKQENSLKEAVDLLVVTLGLIHSFGVDPNKVWKLVHDNNMLKVTGTVVKDENGKVIKSPESIQRKAEMMKAIKELL